MVSSLYLLHRRKAFRAGTWTPAALSPRFWVESFDSATLFDATSGGNLPADGGQIARIEDKSGNGFHLTQATSVNRPLRRVANLNGKDGIDFDGSNDWIENASATFALQNRTLFVVFKEDAVVANAGLVIIKPTTGQDDFDSTTGYFVGPSNRTIDRFHIFGTSFTYILGDNANPETIFPATFYAEVKSGSTATLFRNGISTETDSSFTEFATTSAGGINIGARYQPTLQGPYLNGVVYGVVYVESALSTDDRQRLEGYFAHQLGITANLASDHPYKTSPPYL